MISSESVEQIEHYLSGTLTPIEAERLYEDLQRSKELQCYFELQSQAEYILRTASALDDLEEIDFPSSASSTSISLETLLFDDLIHLEKTAPSLTGQYDTVSAESRADIPKVVKPLTAYRPPSRNQLFRIGSLLTAVVLIVLLAVYSEFAPKPEGFRDRFRSVAQIAESIEAVWEDSSDVYKTGQELEAGLLKLKSGVVKLTFVDGAETVLEGPTEFLIKGRNAAFCPKGQVSAYVPPQAVGFEVSTPFGTIVDLGTQFTILASEKDMEVHVLKGKVDFKSTSKDRFSLVGGAAALLENGNEARMSPADPDVFFSETKMIECRTEYFLKRKAVWEEREKELESDPGLVFRLEPKQTGLALADGSRKNRKAARFRTIRDRYVISVDKNESRSLTLLACVRLEDMRNIGNTLLIGEAHYETQGAFLWQLNRSGMLQFHVNDGKTFRQYDSPAVFQRKDCKTWIMIGLVADAENRTITHYFDGKPIATLPWNDVQPLHLGRMILGNAPSQLERKVARFFNGDIEEFLIFDRPFSSAEIETFYRNHQ